MFQFINSRLSLGARLTLVSLVFSAPILLLAGLFLAAQVGQIQLSRKESAGAAYAQQVWLAMRGKARLAANDGFGETGAYKAFTAAPEGAARTAAAVALIGAVADGSNLTLDPELATFYLADAAVARAPALAGAEAALEDAAQRGDHDAMLLARARLVAANAELQHSLAIAIRQNDDPKVRAALASQVAALKDAVAQTDHEAAMVLSGFAFSVPSGEALQARIDGVFGASRAELQRLLAQRVLRLEMRLALHLGAAGVVVALAAGLA
ncbi:MAG TPA: hypothetical protein VJS38_02660, partial [Phenylobacterium sp.]|uniref:hypothetical protein n=1 Tax=Phenylobacterium sp. TaxID=1871053 RepID=UPI002B461807